MKKNKSIKKRLFFFVKQQNKFPKHSYHTNTFETQKQFTNITNPTK